MTKQTMHEFAGVLFRTQYCREPRALSRAWNCQPSRVWHGLHRRRGAAARCGILGHVPRRGTRARR